MYVMIRLSTRQNEKKKVKLKVIRFYCRYFYWTDRENTSDVLRSNCNFIV